MKRRHTEQQLEEMRIMRRDGASLKEIQAEFGGHLSTISNVLAGVKKPQCSISEVLRRLERIERKLDSR